jgi:hypothetical protein
LAELTAQQAWYILEPYTRPIDPKPPAAATDTNPILGG